jgi:three-Cys-motif partner protein
VARAWGFWTKGKLEILRNYLDAFTTASKSVGERLYFDLFAGETENVDRITGEPLQGSPWVALSVDDPPFTRLRFFEIDQPDELEARLRADFPGRDLRVYPGDCNMTIHEALEELRDLRWAPAFAFIDPNGPDVRWSTLEALATFKANRRNKVELWMLFPEPMFVRFLRTDGGEVEPDHARRITVMYGTDEWLRIYEARLSGRLAPAEARSEYVNLMRWRLQTLLGYAWTHALEVHNEQGRPIYHLIFATDHDAGDRIMRHLYGRALEEFPRMRQQAIDQRKGAMRLFDDSEFGAEPEEYRYEPPWSPYGSE